MSTQRAPLQHTVGYFDGLFKDDDDPWRFRSSWYEARKRALTLASLPRSRYESAFEPGCANGELSAELAPRCARLLVSDGAERAVELARERLAKWPHVEVRRAWVPDEWPDRRFDLVVISELGYFLSADALAMFAAKAKASLLEGGTVLACHWRHGSDDCEFDGAQVHQRLDAALAMPRLCHVLDADFCLDVWSLDAQSAAQREGLV